MFLFCYNKLMFQKLFQLPKLAKYAAPSKKWMDLFEFDIRNIDVSKEKISCTISFPKKLTGNDGIIHGGITCFVIDSIAGIHAQMFFCKNGTALTKNISVNFLQPIIPDEVYMVISRTENKKVLVFIQKDELSYAQGIVEIVVKN